VERIFSHVAFFKTVSGLSSQADLPTVESAHTCGVLMCAVLLLLPVVKATRCRRCCCCWCGSPRQQKAYYRPERRVCSTRTKNRVLTCLVQLDNGRTNFLVGFSTASLHKIDFY